MSNLIIVQDIPDQLSKTFAETTSIREGEEEEGRQGKAGGGQGGLRGKSGGGEGGGEEGERR